MAKKIRLTRPELKRQRDMLGRFNRFLPTLKLKQQQLQMTVLKVDRQHRKATKAVQAAKDEIAPYRAMLADRAGVNVQQLATPTEVLTGRENIAGVLLPVFEGTEFPPLNYSLFSTPAWVDKAVLDLRRLARLQAEADVLGEQLRRLRYELTRIIQRVNLFEKVMIPEASEAIRVIRIKLADEMTAGVGRAKIAKSKIGEMKKSGAGYQIGEPMGMSS